MPRITKRSVDDLKLRVNIADVIGQHVRLQRSGAGFKGLSPFNQEKTPSFYVYPDKGFFHCFSSGQGGDVIRFVELVEKLPFFEAVESLAQRYNVQLEYEAGGHAPTQQDRSLRRELLDIHEQAAHLYHEALFGKNDLAASVRRYWEEKRRFSLDVAREFKIGFAPPDGGELLNILRKKGFSPESLDKCGLFYERNLAPRFRGRLMIPIREQSQGQVIAFTARQLDCTPESDPTREAKYVNSPETPLFRKGDLLFNLDRAREAALKGATMIMVEGQLDAIRCYTSGFKATVAPQGTGVGERQMMLIKRFTDRIVVLLDGDNAGRKAALRILPLAIQAGLEPEFVSLPEKTDPDDLVATGGPDALQGLLDHASKPMTFAAHALLPDPARASPMARSEAMQEIFSILRHCDSEVARIEYLREATTRLGTDFDAASRDFARFILNSRSPQSAPQEIESGEKSKPERLTTAEADLFCLILQYGELAEPVAKTVNEQGLDNDTIEGRLLGRLVWEIREHTFEGLEPFLDAVDDPEERNFIYALKARAISTHVEDPVKDADRLVQRFHARAIQRRMQEIDRSVINAKELTSDLRALLEQKIELHRALKHPPRITLAHR